MLNLEFTPFPVLTTERLVLRQLVMDDDYRISILRSDERVNKYIQRTSSASIEEAQAFVAKINGFIANNESMYWAMSLKGSNTLIGTCCLWNFNADTQTGEIGYELSPDQQGKGFANEALVAVLNYAFETIGLTNLEAYVHADNAASIKLLAKNQFKRNLSAEEQMDEQEKEAHFQIYSLMQV